MFSKVFWLIVNMFRPFFLISESTQRKSDGKNIICVLIEYDAFTQRDVKQVGHISYKCGRASLDLVQEKCLLKSIPVLRVVTSDGGNLGKTASCSGQERVIKNRGTDIAALEDVISEISDYQYVLFCNSSAPYEQISSHIDEFFNILQSYTRNTAFVIGLNGNSRPSPALPWLYRKYPHITSNFFCAQVSDVKNVLDIGSSSFLYPVFGGYGNKYFAIRYFETLLSAYVIKKGGSLIAVGKSIRTFPEHEWFSRDSRLNEYSE